MTEGCRHIDLVGGKRIGEGGRDTCEVAKILLWCPVECMVWAPMRREVRPPKMVKDGEVRSLTNSCCGERSAVAYTRKVSPSKTFRAGTNYGYDGSARLEL